MLCFAVHSCGNSINAEKKKKEIEQGKLNTTNGRKEGRKD